MKKRIFGCENILDYKFFLEEKKESEKKTEREPKKI